MGTIPLPFLSPLFLCVEVLTKCPLKSGKETISTEKVPSFSNVLINRCAKTTSKELGVRICGMQVWDAKTKSYMFQDKYYGRELKVGKDFQNALTRYITATVGDEPRVLTHHIPTIISKITQLGSPPLCRY